MTNNNITTAPLEHEYFCGPRPGEDEPRIEVFSSPKYKEDGITVEAMARVTRCCECAAQRVDW